MDEDFELVPKGSLQKLRDENSRLREEIIKNKKEFEEEVLEFAKKKDDSDIVKVLASIEELKEISRKTLEGVNHKDESIDGRLEHIAEVLEAVTESFGKTIEQFKTSKDLRYQETKSQLDLILGEIKGLERNASSDEKLDHILLFMKNLRVLLSYVEPNSLKINKEEIR